MVVLDHAMNKTHGTRNRTIGTPRTSRCQESERVVLAPDEQRKGKGKGEGGNVVNRTSINGSQNNNADYLCLIAGHWIQVKWFYDPRKVEMIIIVTAMVGSVCLFITFLDVSIAVGTICSALGISFAWLAFALIQIWGSVRVRPFLAFLGAAVMGIGAFLIWRAHQKIMGAICLTVGIYFAWLASTRISYHKKWGSVFAGRIVALLFTVVGMGIGTCLIWRARREMPTEFIVLLAMMTLMVVVSFFNSHMPLLFARLFAIVGQAALVFQVFQNVTLALGVALWFGGFLYNLMPMDLPLLGIDVSRWVNAIIGNSLVAVGLALVLLASVF